MAKSKYEEYIKDNLILVEGWAKDGLTNEQIADNLDIDIATFYRYKNKYCEFRDALKTNKEIADRHVENALYKNALGYSCEEVTKEQVFNKETNQYEMQVTKIVKKEIQGNTSAQIFWLKNRKAKEWKDKQELEHSGGLDIKQTYENMSEDELLELAKRYEKINKST